MDAELIKENYRKGKHLVAEIEAVTYGKGYAPESYVKYLEQELKKVDEFFNNL